MGGDVEVVAAKMLRQARYLVSGLLVFSPSCWEEFRAKASHRLRRFRQRRRTRVVPSLEALAVELRLHLEGVWALREKSLAPGSWAADGGGYVAPFLEALS